MVKAIIHFKSGETKYIYNNTYDDFAKWAVSTLQSKWCISNDNVINTSEIEWIDKDTNE